MRRVAMLCGLAACGRVGFNDMRAGDGAVGDGAIGDGAAGDGRVIDGFIGSGGSGLVQASPVLLGTGPVTVNLPQPTGAGTLLIATMGVNSTSSLVLPTGWQQNGSGTINGSCTALIASNSAGTAGVTSVTFTLAAGAPYAVAVSEWNGYVGIDTGGFGGGMTPTATLSVNSAVPATKAGDVGIAMFCEDTTNPTFTPGAGWTSLGQASTFSSSPSGFAEYAAGLPAATITATGTSSVTAKYAAVVVGLAAP
jgi:hypothetical protein